MMSGPQSVFVHELRDRRKGKVVASASIDGVTLTQIRRPITLEEAHYWMRKWEGTGAGAYASFMIDDEEYHYLEDIEELGDSLTVAFWYKETLDAMDVLERYFDQNLEKIDDIPNIVCDRLQEALDEVVFHARMYEMADAITVHLTDEDRKTYGNS
jgi:hypothetical protein